MSNKRLATFICILFFIQVSLVLAVRVDDFRINEGTIGSPQTVHVSADRTGRFVVAWIQQKAYVKQFRLDGSIVGKLIEAPDIFEQEQKLGLHNTTVALQPDGKIILLRTMGKDSTDSQGNFYPLDRGYLNIFDSLGNNIVESFRPDSLPAEGNYRFRYYWNGLACDKNGNFVVAFNTNNGTCGPDNQIFFQRFYPDGSKNGNLTNLDCGNLNECNFCIQDRSLSMNCDGRFVISWDAAHGQYPHAALYYPDGTPVREPFILSCGDSLVDELCTLPGKDHCMAMGSAPKVGIDSFGNFMTAFNGCGPDPTGTHVKARLFDSLGNERTPNMDIQELEYTGYYWHRPWALATQDGGYVVVWADKTLWTPDKPGVDIWAKRFNADGQQIGIKYRINNPVSSVISGEVFGAAISNGHLFVTWLDIRGRPEVYAGVYAQIMPVEEVGVFTPGDLNYDYSVNLTDLIGIVNYVFKGADPPEGSPLVCDVNGDCKVTLADIIYLVNYLFKGGPVPQPGCA